MAVERFTYKGKVYQYDYELFEVVSYEGKDLEITDWGLFHRPLLQAIGLNKPSELVEWYYNFQVEMGYRGDFMSATHKLMTSHCGFYTDPQSYSSYMNYAEDWLSQVRHYTVLDGRRGVWDSLLDNLYTSTPTTDTAILLDLVTQTSEVITLYKADGGLRSSTETTQPYDLNLPLKWTKRFNYSYKMDATDHNFFRTLKGEGKSIFFGLELEVSTKLSVKELQYIVTEVEPKQEPFFIVKDDSSVTGRYGYLFELVTVPCSPRYLKVAFTTFFDKLKRLARAKGMSLDDVFDTSSELRNGIHIHIDRKSFAKGRRRTHLGKFAALFNLSDEESFRFFKSINHRPGDYRYGGYCPIDENLKKYRTSYLLKEAPHSNVRGSVNMRNSSTVEVRMFQGIVDLDHLRKCIDFTQAMLEYSEFCPISKIRKGFVQDFKTYVVGSGKFNSLKKEFKLCA